MIIKFNSMTNSDIISRLLTGLGILSFAISLFTLALLLTVALVALYKRSDCEPIAIVDL